MNLTNINILIFTLCLLIIKNCSCELKLLILHNNDMHSHFEETSSTAGICQTAGHCYGGFPRISKTVKRIRNTQNEQTDKRHVIFLNAGDTFQGSAYYSIFKKDVVAEMMNLIGLDAMSLGNHEFDDGPGDLAEFLKKVKVPSVAANIDTSRETCFKGTNLSRYIILKPDGEVPVAVIGYVTPATKYLSKAGEVEFSDEIAAIKAVIEELKRQNISIFIALGHSGYKVDLDIAKMVPDIDLVVGGHTNTFLYNGEPPDLEKPIDSYPKIVTQDSGRKVPVVQAYAFTKYLGYLEIDFDGNGEMRNYSGNPLLLDKSYGEDIDVLKELEKWQNKLKIVTNVVVGKTEVFLDAHNHACKLGKCNIGNLIVDAMIEANSINYNGSGWTDAPIAITQAGGIRSSIDASKSGGNVTYGDIITVLPNENKLMKVKLKGMYLLEALEFSVHRFYKTDIEQVGEFLQVSGLQVTYDMSRASGSRVVSVKVRCGLCNVPSFSDINENEDYTLIISEYLAEGGDNYTVIEENIHDIIRLDTTDTASVVDYFKRRSPVYPFITNRIILINVEEPTVPTPETTTLSTTTIVTTITTENSTMETLETNSTEITGSTQPLTSPITQVTTDATTFNITSPTTAHPTFKPKPASANSLNSISALIIFTIMYAVIHI